MKRKNLRVTLATVPKHIPYSMHTVLLCKSQSVCNQFIQSEMLEGAMGGGWVGGSLRSSTPGSGLNGCEILGRFFEPHFPHL